MPGNAARQGDQTSHGGSIIEGCPTVFINGKPAARMGDMQVCPMVSGAVPHGATPIMTGVPVVLIGGKPAATVGDLAGPPCAGAVIMGSANVLIGTDPPAAIRLKAKPTSPVAMQAQAAQADETCVSGQEAEAEEPGRDAESESETVAGETISISNAGWSTDTIGEGVEVKLTAAIANIPEGVEIRLQIFEKGEADQRFLLKTMPAQAEGNKVEDAWTFRYTEYHESLEQILTEEEQKTKGGHYQHPEFIFTAEYQDAKAESGVMKFKDRLETEVRNFEGTLMTNEAYVLTFADGKEERGRTGGDGKIIKEDVPPGRIRIHFPDSPELDTETGE